MERALGAVCGHGIQQQGQDWFRIGSRNHSCRVINQVSVSAHNRKCHVSQGMQPSLHSYKHNTHPLLSSTPAQIGSLIP